MAAILIIDPDMNTRLRMCEALEAANHRCYLAADVAEGCEIARHSSQHGRTTYGRPHSEG